MTALHLPRGLSRYPASAVGAAILIGGFVLLKLALVVPAQSDENIYFYAAQLVANGLSPYEDFFFAHPPLHLWLLASVIKVVGFHLTACRVIPVLSMSASAGLLFWLLARRLGGGPALVGVALLLFTGGALQFSTHAYGLTPALALVIGAMVALDRAHPLLAAGLLAAALLTRFSVAPAVAVVVALAIIRHRRPGLRVAGVLTALFALSQGLLLGRYGTAYWTPVFAYHLQKPTAPHGFGVFLEMLWREDYYLVLLAIIGLGVTAVLTVRRFSGRSVPNAAGDFPLGPLAQLAAVVTTGYLVFFAVLSQVFAYYALLVYPFLAILAAQAIAHLGQLFRRARPNEKQLRWLGLTAAALLVIIVWLRPLTPGPPSGILPHPWQSPEPMGPARWIRVAFFRAEEQRGAAYCPITRYTWSVQRHAFPTAHGIADWIADRTTKDETLLGDSMQIPLVALLAHRRTVANIVDLNPMRFRAALPPITELVAHMEDPSLTYVLLNPDPNRGDLFQFPEVQRALADHFFPEQQFGPFVLYRRLP